jgi:hypothetical protein
LESSDGLFSVSCSIWLICSFIWSGYAVMFKIVNKFIQSVALLHLAVTASQYHAFHFSFSRSWCHHRK